MPEINGGHKMFEALKPREWILIILLISGVQFFVHTISYLYSGSANALSYVSFAGTIVSILLGLIAIIYSFAQNISQSSSVSEIKKQVKSLVKTAGELAGSKDLIHASALEIGGASEAITKAVERNTEKVALVEGKLDSMLVESPDVRNSTGERKGSILDSNKKYVRLACLAIDKAIEKEWSMLDLTRNVIDKWCVSTSLNRDSILGIFSTVAMALEAEGFVAFKDPRSAIRKLVAEGYDENIKILKELLHESKNKEVLEFKSILSEEEDKASNLG